MAIAESIHEYTLAWPVDAAHGDPTAFVVTEIQEQLPDCGNQDLTHQADH